MRSPDKLCAELKKTQQQRVKPFLALVQARVATDRPPARRRARVAGPSATLTGGHGCGMLIDVMC
jgi:hypothetical protein